jgi:hypothetical protein
MQVEKLIPERPAPGSRRENIRMVGSPKPTEAMRASH